LTIYSCLSTHGLLKKSELPLTIIIFNRIQYSIVFIHPGSPFGFSLIKRGAHRGNRKNKNSLQGNIAELGNNVYLYGTRDEGAKFIRSMEAIANYVGREYSKEMRLLVKTQKENESKERVMPGKEEAKSPLMMKKYEKIR
jgi:hypothetical protein